MRIHYALIGLVALLTVLATRPLTYILKGGNYETRGYISILIRDKIEQIFTTRKEIPYVNYGLSSVGFYYQTPETTTAIRYNDFMIYYNIYKRKNNTNTITHTLSIKPIESNYVSVDLHIKIFQDKISFVAQPRPGAEISGLEYEIVNKLEGIVIVIGREKASLDEYQLKRLVEYLK